MLKKFKVVSVGLMAAMLSCNVATAAATMQQTASSATTTQQVEALYVIAAASATVTKQGDAANYRLALQTPSVNYFTDRPVRKAGAVDTTAFVAAWVKGTDNFSQDNPNAALVAGFDVSDSKQAAREFVVLKHPVFDAKANTLQFDITVFHKDHVLLQGSFEHAALFIDNLGCSLRNVDSGCI